VRDGRLGVDGAGEPDGWWAVVGAAAWAHLDETGEPPDVSDLSVPGAGETAG
jgi:hypothetical protein